MSSLELYSLWLAGYCFVGAVGFAVGRLTSRGDDEPGKSEADDADWWKDGRPSPH